MTSFLRRRQITSPKICHQNDVTKIFHFQAPPPLNKILVATLYETVAFVGLIWSLLALQYTNSWAFQGPFKLWSKDKEETVKRNLQETEIINLYFFS